MGYEDFLHSFISFSFLTVDCNINIFFDKVTIIHRSDNVFRHILKQ